MSNENKRFSYESPNIVIVPTVSFIDDPPAKKIKLDGDSKKVRTANTVNKTFKSNSWASNYLHSIGQSQQLASSSKPIICQPDKSTTFTEAQKKNTFSNSLPENGKPSGIKTNSLMHTPSISKSTLPSSEVKGTKENENVLHQNPPKSISPISWFFGSFQTNSDHKLCTSDIGDKHAFGSKKEINEKENSSTMKQSLPKSKSPISWFFGSNPTNAAFTKCTSNIGDDSNKKTLVTQKQINIKGTKENISNLQQNPPKSKSPISWFFGSSQIDTKQTSDIGGTSVAQKRMKEKDNNISNLETAKPQLHIAKNHIILTSSSSLTATDKISKKQKQNKAYDNDDLQSIKSNNNESKYKFKKDSERDINEHHKQQIKNKLESNKIKLNASHDYRTKQCSKVVKKPLTKIESGSGIKNPNIQEIDNRVKLLLSSVLPVQTSKKTDAIQLNLLKKQSITKAPKINKKVRNVETPTRSRIISSAENLNKEDKQEKNNENKKDKILRKQHHLDVSTLKKKRLKDLPSAKVPVKHKLKHKSSRKGCDIEEHLTKHRKEEEKKEVHKVIKVGLKNEYGKILMKKTNLKSVVQLTNHFDSDAPSKTYAESHLEVEDLRKKLNRGKKYRDNLIVSMPNDVIFEQENKIKEDLPKEIKPNEPKVTTIKLVINLIAGKTKNKSIEEKPRGNETNERELASIDLSFLDDFNVDDIVESLNYDVNTCNLIKEDDKKPIPTKLVTCEAPNTSPFENNVLYTDLKLGTTCENKNLFAQDGRNDEVIVHNVKKEKTSSELNESFIRIDEAPITDEEITSKITSNKQIICKPNRKIVICENKHSALSSISSQKTVTVNNESNSIESSLFEPSTEPIKKETEYSATEHPAGQNSAVNFDNESPVNLESDAIQELTEPKQETGIDIQHPLTDRTVATKTETATFNFKSPGESCSINPVTESEASLEMDSLLKTNINMQHSNINITDEITGDNLLKLNTTFIVSSREKTAATVIDLTETDQNELQANNDVINNNISVSDSYIDLTEPELNIKPKQQHPSDIDIACNANDSMKHSSFNIDSSETCDDILIIDLTESERNIEPISQQLVTNLNNTISSNMEISETNNLLTHLAKSDREPELEIQNNYKDKKKPECNSIITNKKEAICTSPSVHNSNETEYHDQDSTSIVNESSQNNQESVESWQGISDTMPLGLKKTSLEEFLSESLKQRMLDYFHINYDIGMLVRRGKYSRIFHCTDQKKNDYAVKILHSQKDRIELGVKKENMIMEMQKDIPKQNLHFVHLISGFGMQGRWCFLMEFYPLNLNQVLRCRKKSFHIDDVQRLSRQLVSAVIMLRHNNIIHSDIKPEHVLLNSSLETLKLCGFDAFRKADEVVLLPNIGTCSYRAPELILGYSDGFTIDVWSAALVMFEMATGHKLFPGVYNNDILYKQMNILGPIPYEIVMSSIFKEHHFFTYGTQITFMRKTGPNGKHIVYIEQFFRIGIANEIYKGQRIFFNNTGLKGKAYNKQKLRSFCDLLDEMLVMDPKQRLPIEFVYANPFLYEYCTENGF